MVKTSPITVINNAGFIKDKDDIFITKTTGEFLHKLYKKTNSKITLFQFSEKCKVESGINNYKLSDDAYNLCTVPYYSNIWKFWSYFLLMPKLFLLLTGKKQFVYIFFPGNVAYISALICSVFKIPFGLYVRGEYNLRTSKYIFKKAKFINTVGVIFKEEIKLINSNCDLIKPMVQFDFSKLIGTKNVEKSNEILYVGRVETRKGIWEIIEASNRLEIELPDYKIRIVGSGLELNNVKNYVEQNNLSNIILHGAEFNVDRLAKLFLQSKIFLFPSHDEGFPRVLYEAMYFKIPIITTFVGNISGIMTDKSNCLRIDVKSSQSIVDKLLLITQDDYIYKKLVLNASKTLKEVFNDSVKIHEDLLIEGIRKNEKNLEW